MRNSDDIIAAARRWIGVKWKHQGRTRSGIDCLGLVVLVAQELDIANVDQKTYSPRPDGSSLVRRFNEEMDEVSLTVMRPGDVILFADSAYPCHVAFVSEKHGQLHIIHAHATRRQVLEERYAFEWPVKARKAFRFREGV
jgi:cell wall-associated NlpC family hydrolase